MQNPTSNLTIGLPVAACLILLTTSFSHAALIVHEDFNFSGTVVGNGSGSGWSTAWAGGSVYNTTSGLSYSNGGGSESTAGNAVVRASDGNQITRDLLSTVANTAGTTVWVSFLVSQSTSNYTDVAIFNGGTEGMSFGQTYNGTGLSSTYSMYFTGGSAGYANSGVAVDTTGTTNLLVLQLDFSAGSTAAYLYRNPTLGATPATSSAIASFITTRNLSFNRIRLENSATNNVMDEIRVGNTFADVSTVVPEPGSTLLCLAGIGFTALLRRR